MVSHPPPGLYGIDLIHPVMRKEKKKKRKKRKKEKRGTKPAGMEN